MQIILARIAIKIPFFGLVLAIGVVLSHESE